MTAEEALKLLGFSQSDVSAITTDQLRKSYLKLALATHPDKNKVDPTASRRFTDLKQAYDLALASLSEQQNTAAEQQHTEQLLNLFLRALQGENVELGLEKLGIYRPSAEFGIDLHVPFDKRLPPPPVSAHGSGEDAVVDIQTALKEAFLDEGLNGDGDPIEGWARPPTYYSD